MRQSRQTDAGSMPYLDDDLVSRVLANDGPVESATLSREGAG